MIQRIQTLYLLLTIIISVLFLEGNIIWLTVDHEPAFIITMTGVYQPVNENNAELQERLLPLTAVSAMVPLIFLVAIFLYKRRNLQSKIIVTGIIMIIIMIAVLSYDSLITVSTYKAEIIPTIKMIYPPVLILFAILAYRAVQKDELLVKSYDRLR